MFVSYSKNGQKSLLVYIFRFAVDTTQIEILSNYCVSFALLAVFLVSDVPVAY